MPKRNEYLDWLCERLAPLGPVRAKSMFGGWGLYCDELFFAIVVDDILYVKADAQSRPEFAAEGLQPFTYPMKDGRLQSMNYFPLPDAALDDDALLIAWARKGVMAALRAPRKGTKAR